MGRHSNTSNIYSHHDNSQAVSYAGEVKRLSRGIPTPLGTLGANGNAVAFKHLTLYVAALRKLVITVAAAAKQSDLTTSEEFETKEPTA
jgi:hypothetical protein